MTALAKDPADWFRRWSGSEVKALRSSDFQLHRRLCFNVLRRNGPTRMLRHNILFGPGLGPTIVSSFVPASPP
ncbi:unnamed protein product [Lactuca virosa]|uniref:Uncharacterized protein n=1 Tax=Lactuca virosa TaxID=75947 RepID=A0AAU9MNZ3_9ASTR|nr:unnamed protein product [Lactuca virosa]